MSTGHARLSISELRRKTDRELLALVRHQSERSLRLARRGDISEAAALCSEAEALLAVAPAAENERAELAARLGIVRAILQPNPPRVACANSAWSF